LLATLSLASCASNESKYEQLLGGEFALGDFQPLFDGESLSGWWGCATEDPRGIAALSAEDRAERRLQSLDDIEAHWRVENSILINDGEGLFLTTEREYRDFELLLEFKTVAGADSGVYLRGIPQVQIWDTTEAGGKWHIGAKLGSGGLWNNSPSTPGKNPLVHADKPFGEWNRLRIVLVGERVSVWLNDKLTVDHARLENYFDRSSPIPRAGPIQLQTHGGEISWRNLFIREIGAAEANQTLSAHSGEGFGPIFDGETFDGWLGPIEGYEIADGALVCRKDFGGTIFNEQVFTDFEVKFEVLLPPAGNNGLAIRYPGSGDTAYVGMCELQILENTAEQWADLDPRQYHGSAYGMAPAHRGYLRSPGTWNFQRVRVVGPTIEVELNGTRILSADLSRLTDAMYPLDRFAGRMRTSGHFGFAGHTDPVAFRHIEARSLAVEASRLPSPTSSRGDLR